MSFWRQFWVLVQCLFLAVLAVLVATLVFFQGIPGVLGSTADLQDRHDGLQRQLEDEQRMNQFLREFGADPDLYTREMKTLEQQRAIQRRIVPDEPELESFQATVKRDAAATGVRLIAFPAPKPLDHDDSTEEIVKAELEGSYDAVQAFLRRVEREERLVRVSRILLTSPAPPNTPQHRIVPGGPVHVSCELTAFYRHDPPPPVHR